MLGIQDAPRQCKYGPTAFRSIFGAKFLVPGKVFEVFEYNAHNKIEKIIDPQKFETVFYYDQMGNLTGTKDAEENNITHEYDNLGRRTKTIKHFKDGQKIETTFEYYPANTYNPNDTQNPGQYSPSNRLKSITDDKGNKTTYEYDHHNRIKKIIYPDDCFVFKLPAGASHWLPAPVEKTNLLTTPLNNFLIVGLALRLREGDIISRLCLAE